MTRLKWDDAQRLTLGNALTFVLSARVFHHLGRGMRNRSRTEKSHFNTAKLQCIWNLLMPLAASLRPNTLPGKDMNLMGTRPPWLRLDSM